MAVAITVNGVALSTLASKVESMRRTSPALRGNDIEIPGRHGSLALPHRSYGPGSIVWPMWLKGVDPTTGQVSAGTTVDELRRRYDAMCRLFGPFELDVRYTYDDGTVRKALCRLWQEPLDFEEQPASPWFGRFTPALTIPGAFFSDVSAVTSGPHVLASGAEATLTEFAGATAPMDELTVTFGPGSNPSLSQPSTGFFVAYDGVIAAGQELVVETETWSLSTGAGTSWTPDVTLLRFGPVSRWFALTPPADGSAPVVALTNTGGTSVSVTITGRRKYLVG